MLKMPRSKEGKKRPVPSNKVFEEAVIDVLERGFSIRKSALDHGVSKYALVHSLKKYKESGLNTLKYEPHYNVKQVFTMELEEMLVKYIETSARLHYGFSTINIWHMNLQNKM